MKDLIVFSKKCADYVSDLHKVLQRSWDFSISLSLNPKKRIFKVVEKKLFGHVIKG
jgi:hypothetical protein